MAIQVLIVEDTPEYVQQAQDVIDSLGYQLTVAGDLESARRHLTERQFDLMLLDLQFPTAPGRVGRKQNGINLLTEIRENLATAAMPIIVVTGHGLNGPDLATAVMRDGATDFVGKTAEAGVLDVAIRRALAKAGKAGQSGITPAATTAAAPEAFSAAQREMVIYEDRVTICGIEVWRDTGQSDMRALLLLLNRKEGGGYVHLSGPELANQLGRNDSNPISRPIKDFRDNVATRLREARNLIVEREDVIASRNGYHYAPWLTVTVAGQAEEAAPATALAAAPPPVTESEKRQAWIQAQLAMGKRLYLKDIVFHTKKDRSTVLRDLQALKNRGLVQTSDEGGYVLGPAAAQPCVGGEVARG